MAEHLFSYLDENFEELIEEIAPRENLKYLYEFQIAPTQQGPQPIILFVLTAPSGVLGQEVLSIRPMPLALASNPDAIKSLLRDIWAEMQAQRADVLGQNHDNAIDVNSKLIVPGK